MIIEIRTAAREVRLSYLGEPLDAFLFDASVVNKFAKAFGWFEEQACCHMRRRIYNYDATVPLTRNSVGVTQMHRLWKQPLNQPANRSRRKLGVSR